MRLGSWLSWNSWICTAISCWGPFPLRSGSWHTKVVFVRQKLDIENSQWDWALDKSEWFVVANQSVVGDNSVIPLLTLDSFLYWLRWNHMSIRLLRIRCWLVEPFISKRMRLIAQALPSWLFGCYSVGDRKWAGCPPSPSKSVSSAAEWFVRPFLTVLQNNNKTVVLFLFC